MLETFMANLKHAVATCEAVSIGGGLYTPEELRQVLKEYEALKNTPPCTCPPTGALTLCNSALRPSPPVGLRTEASEVPRATWMKGPDNEHP